MSAPKPRSAAAARQARYRERQQTKKQADEAIASGQLPSVALDFAAMVRDRAALQFDSGQLDLSDKDTVPGIKAGLQAQGILDKREVQKAKQGTAELAFAIIAMLNGTPAPPKQIEDGLTVEGDYVEVD